MNIICLIWNMHISIFQIRQIFVLDQAEMKYISLVQLSHLKFLLVFWTMSTENNCFDLKKVCLTKKIEVVAFNVISTFLFWVYRKSALPKCANLYTAYTINIAPIPILKPPESFKYPSSTIIILYLTYDPQCINFKSQAFF